MDLLLPLPSDLPMGLCEAGVPLLFCIIIVFQIIFGFRVGTLFDGDGMSYKPANADEFWHRIIIYAAMLICSVVVFADRTVALVILMREGR